MPIAHIIAPVTGSKRDAAVLATAFVAAKAHNAHVVALFVHPDSRLALPYAGEGLTGESVQTLVDSAQEMNSAAAAAARTMLAEAAEAAGAEIVSGPQKAKSTSCCFREMGGFFPRCIAHAAQYSDLIVFGPITPGDGPDFADAFCETLLKTERPVLLAAEAPKSLTGKVTVAWDGSAVANRALVGALPFLERAREITLLSCHSGASQKPLFRHAEEYLAAHGLSATEVEIPPGKHGVGEALLDTAVKGGSDLLVMGGYGHSQMSEAFFGGVTQYIRWHVSLPVLMIH
jgi:nucleotide-binding universal stress UspA family protein